MPNRLIKMLFVAALQEIESTARMRIHSKCFLTKYNSDDLVGKSENIICCKKMASIYANTNNTVLITG